MKRHGAIGLSDEQAEILESATKYCRDKSPIETVRRLIEDEVGYDPAVFAEMAELGWLGIAIPEQYGGAGLELAEVVPVVEQMGRNLMGGPFLSTTLATQVLLAGGTEAQKSQVLPELAAGTPATLALMEPHADWDPGHIECRAERKGETLVLCGTKTLVADGQAAQSMPKKPAACWMKEKRQLTLPNNECRMKTWTGPTPKSSALSQKRGCSIQKVHAEEQFVYG